MSLFGKNAITKEHFKGFTDCHSHILPGVDDGVGTMEEALKILSIYERLGVQKVWLTPHIMEDCPNEIADLSCRFDQLLSEYKGDITLALASENMIDCLFEKRLESGELLAFGDEGNHLLVETSYFSAPIRLYEMLERIKSKGYYPVLAHPERYTYMDKADYLKLNEMGVKFQLNLFSLNGFYGPTARKKAQWLKKKGLYSFEGTDLHRVSTLYIKELKLI